MKISKTLVTHISLGTIAAAGGFLGGYLVAKKKFLAVAEEEITSIKATYSKLRANLEKPKLEDLIPIVVAPETGQQVADRIALGEAAFIARTQGYTDDISRTILDADVAEGLERSISNVFDDHGPEITGLPEELTTANPYTPYIVSYDSYMSDVWDKHSKVSLTYYAEDKTLIDEREEVMEGIEEFLGDSLHHFGALNDDPDMVYVRNEKLGLDYEIVKDDSSYAHKVLGLPVHFKDENEG